MFSSGSIAPGKPVKKIDQKCFEIFVTPRKKIILVFDIITRN
jgi:hypothetical protein